MDRTTWLGKVRGIKVANQEGQGSGTEAHDNHTIGYKLSPVIGWPWGGGAPVSPRPLWGWGWPTVLGVMTLAHQPCPPQHWQRGPSTTVCSLILNSYTLEALSSSDMDSSNVCYRPQFQATAEALTGSSIQPHSTSDCLSLAHYSNLADTTSP